MARAVSMSSVRCLALVLAVLALGAVNRGYSDATSPTGASPDCTNQGKLCKAVICYNGIVGDCLCFTCRHGTPEIYVVCTNDPKTIKDLMTKAGRNKQKCPKPKP